jgi:hypothetical protein
VAEHHHQFLMQTLSGGAGEQRLPLNAAWPETIHQKSKSKSTLPNPRLIFEFLGKNE